MRTVHFPTIKQLRNRERRPLFIYPLPGSADSNRNLASLAPFSVFCVNCCAVAGRRGPFYMCRAFCRGACCRPCHRRALFKCICGKRMCWSTGFVHFFRFSNQKLYSTWPERAPLLDRKKLRI